jgi:hypothetical protein
MYFRRLIHSCARQLVPVLTAQVLIRFAKTAAIQMNPTQKIQVKCAAHLQDAKVM